MKRYAQHSSDDCQEFLCASLLSQLTGLPAIVVSKATVFFVHEDQLDDDISFKDLSRRLLGSVQRDYDLRVRILLKFAQQNDSSLRWRENHADARQFHAHSIEK